MKSFYSPSKATLNSIFSSFDPWWRALPRKIFIDFLYPNSFLDDSHCIKNSIKWIMSMFCMYSTGKHVFFDFNLQTPLLVCFPFYTLHFIERWSLFLTRSRTHLPLFSLPAYLPHCSPVVRVSLCKLFHVIAVLFKATSRKKLNKTVSFLITKTRIVWAVDSIIIVSR